MDDWIYITWRGNGRSKYNGQTHKVLKDILVNPPSNLKVGDPVVVYWESDPQRKFWKAEVASAKQTSAPAAARYTTEKSIIQAISTPTG